jgi:hypothetical protein
LLAGLPTLVNYVSPLRNERRRTIHDRMAATLVVRT